MAALADHKPYQLAGLFHLLDAQETVTIQHMFHHCADNLKSVPGICHAFMTRQGGTSPAPWDSLNVSYHVGDVSARVDENRARICMQWGLPPSALYVSRQVHGVRLLRVEKNIDFLQVRQQEADALYTCEPGVLVGVSTADCAPILLSCDDGRAVCAVHAGWRGAAAGIVAHVLKQLEQHLGISPAQWLAAVGPCIGANAFTVGSDVFEAFSAYRNCFVQKNANKWTFDLAGTLSQQLRECGVEHIEILNHCTFDSSHGFFSHRAALSKASGRQLSFIGICSENFS